MRVGGKKAFNLLQMRVGGMSAASNSIKNGFNLLQMRVGGLSMGSNSIQNSHSIVIIVGDSFHQMTAPTSAHMQTRFTFYVFTGL